jgi:hypothetical protein
MRAEWENAPIVYTVVPPPIVCPHCRCEGAPNYTRSENNGADGSMTRKAECKQCQRRFLVVAEPLGPDCQ